MNGVPLFLSTINLYPIAQRYNKQRKDDPEVQREIQKLREIDRKVKAHEMAHVSVGGPYAGMPVYSYVKGPDGKLYAVAGEVPIDVSEERDPEETVRKMERVIAAALAPADPSPQDLKVAAVASVKLAKARHEIMQKKLKETYGVLDFKTYTERIF
ncbi:MAG: hypothetical protein DSZ31_03765 [Gammaproteobacteria bacterium]|nr:MAG: hypothetical protein DSZ31_03765 [Gammaproteobacteria bacterium]